jgi:hypothetical protein
VEKGDAVEHQTKETLAHGRIRIDIACGDLSYN